MTAKIESFSFIDKKTRRFASQFLEILDTPVSLGIFLCLKYKDDFSACSHEINPRTYQDAETFGKDYQASKLLAKFKESPASHAKKRMEESLVKFWGCEDHLASVNPRLREVLYSSNQSDEYLRRVFYTARDKIASILKSVKDRFKVELCNFGPGASSSVSGRRAHPSNKYLASDISSGCVPFYHWFFQGTWINKDSSWPSGQELNLVESSRIQVVSKNFKADRIIAIEPDWNIFFQKGIGAAIRQALLEVGIDLDNGGALHELLAKFGSVFGSLATLDLSSASDLVSLFLVRFLLPEDWFLVMNSLRTSSVEIDGKTIPLRKFSSMGNGFTFELESLIYYALAFAVQETTDDQDSVSVFGDDIIVPTRSVGLLTEVLTTAGFKLNKDKSFADGYFRESCGAHFFNGKDVKPFYIRNGFHNDPEIYKALNGLRVFVNRHCYHDIHDSPYANLYASGKRLLKLVFYIPAGFGDGGLVSNFDEVTPSATRKRSLIWRPRHGIEGFYVKCLLPVTHQRKDESIGLYMHKLRELERYYPRFWTPDGCPPSGNSIDIRSNDTTVFRKGRMHVKEWLNQEDVLKSTSVIRRGPRTLMESLKAVRYV